MRDNHTFVDIHMKIVLLRCSISLRVFLGFSKNKTDPYFLTCELN